MAHTSAEEIAKVIEVDEAIDLAPFIEIANELVEECCGDAEYTEDRLRIIETWLAAHFYAIRDPRLSSEGAGPISSSFQSRVDLGFDVTHYGQQAMRVDTAGGLAALNATTAKPNTSAKKTVKVTATWLGKDQT